MQSVPHQVLGSPTENAHLDLVIALEGRKTLLAMLLRFRWLPETPAPLNAVLERPLSLASSNDQVALVNQPLDHEGVDEILERI